MHHEKIVKGILIVAPLVTFGLGVLYGRMNTSETEPTDNAATEIVMQSAFQKAMDNYERSIHAGRTGSVGEVVRSGNGIRNDIRNGTRRSGADS